MGHPGAGALKGEQDVYRSRRERVLEQLGDSAILVLASMPEIQIGRAAEQRYVVDPELFYLTGYREPEAVAVLGPAHSAAPFTLFVRPRDPERELWTGPRGGPDAALETFGAQAAHAIGELSERLPALLSRADQIYAHLESGRPALDEVIRRAVVQGRRTRAKIGRGPGALLDPGLLLDEMRVVKDAHEVELIRRAALITAESFVAAASRIRPAAGEWEVEAALEAGFRERAADGFAFPTIVAGGANATVLHYVSNDQKLQDGSLVLLDAGARYRMYCADISRTLPVNGRFTAQQRDVYECVLRAHTAACAAVKPGVAASDVHAAALRGLIDGLRDLGLITASTDEALQDEKIYQPFCPHNTSHWLGLDVHDVGAYATRTGPRPLEPGMVLTIEPGMYIASHQAGAPAALRGIGIRIEDDLLVTERGSENLTATLPTRAEDVEAWLLG